MSSPFSRLVCRTPFADSAVMLSAFLLVACGGACGGDSGNDNPADAGSSNGDGGDVDRVSATLVVASVAENEVRELPLDLSLTPIQAVLVASNGETTRIPGLGGPDGTISITGVPEGHFLLRFGNIFVQTDKRRLDLGFARLGRVDVGALDIHTPIVGSFLNLSPWTDGDVIELFSPNAGFTFLNSLVASPTNGVTEYSGTVDFFLAQSPRAVDTADGDVLYVSQVRSRPVGSDQVREVVSGASVSTGLSVESGETEDFDVSMIPLASARSHQITWDPSAFGELLGSMGPGDPVTTSADSRLVASSADPSWGVLAAYPTLAGVEIQGVDPVAHTASFESPFPSHWHEYEVDSVSATFDIAGNGNYMITARAQTISAPGRVAEGAVPLISAPHQPTINGGDARTPLSSVGVTPEIRWSPPLVGAADGYELVVRQLTPSARTVTTIFTTRAEVILPNELLLDEGTYYLVIRARSTPGLDLGFSPLRRAVPSASAEFVSAVFSPASL